jgi:flagellar basal-body rod protein FlgC
MDMAHTWLDMIAGNIANANDISPVGQPGYRSESPIAVPAQTGNPPGGVAAGVTMAGVALGPKGKLAYDPASPYANAQGYVQYPSVSMGTQLVNLVIAQDSYQSNVAVATHAISAYQSALTLGS